MDRAARDERSCGGDVILSEDVKDPEDVEVDPVEPPTVFHGRMGKANYKDYLKKLETDEEFYAMSAVEQSKVLGVTSWTVRQWEKMVNWKDLSLKFDDMYWKVKPLIMTALYRKAIKGDTKAIELSFQKGEGWFAKSGMEVNVNRKFDGVADADLLKEAIKSLPLEEKKSLLGFDVEASVGTQE